MEAPQTSLLRVASLFYIYTLSAFYKRKVVISNPIQLLYEIIIMYKNIIFQC